FRLATYRPKPRTAFDHTGPTIGRVPDVYGVLEQSTDYGPIPDGFALRTANAQLLQATANLPKREPVPAYPFEDLFDDTRLFQTNLVVRLTAGDELAHVAIPVGCSAQHAHRSLSSRMALTAATPLHNLGAFVLGDHALHLQEQILLRTDTDCAVQKDQVDPGTLQLFDQQHLPRILAGQSIGRVNVEPF